MKPTTPQHQARQALKAALNGRNYGYDDVYAAPYQGVHADGQVILSKEAARLIDQLLTRAHYEALAEEAEKQPTCPYCGTTEGLRVEQPGAPGHKNDAPNTRLGPPINLRRLFQAAR